jgi:tRNA(Ile)-lysidine synthase
VNRLIGEVEADIIHRGLLPDGKTVLAAVSGGVDSVVLLEILHRLSQRHHWKLIVAHFNHQLRGKQSDGDERFVCSLARRLGLQCVVGRERVARQARLRGISVEMAGRDARHAFLAATAREQNARFVALAHHADDQVELFLLRILRGASVDGLGGMSWTSLSPRDPQLRLVRPLLGRRKDELLDLAGALSISFRRDRTNHSTDILRNRVRHDLIPLLCRRYQPGLVGVVLRQAELCAADAEFLSRVAHRWMSSRRPAFAELATSLQRRVVLEQLLKLGIQPEFDKVESLRRKAGHPVQVDNSVVVRRFPDGTIERDTVARRKPLAGDSEGPMISIRLKGRAGKINFGPYRIEWSIQRGKAPPVHRRKSGQEWFDGDAVGTVVQLRTRRPGDRFQPLGMPKPCKLQDLLTNARIAREKRDELALAVDSHGTIWWVDGLRIGEACKVGPETRRFLRWKWLLK